MKKLLIIIIALGLVTGVLNTTFAAPSSVIVDSKNNGGSDPMDGISFDFEVGIYEFSVANVEQNGWNSILGIPGNWFWNVSVYNETTDNDYFFGTNNLFSSQNNARDATAALGSLTITINQKSKLWFHINESSPTNNSGHIAMNVSIAPEPLSSTLFVIGGIAFAGRRYFKRKIS